jgi:hypothetical protein
LVRGRLRLRREVTDGVASEQLAEGTAVHVGEGMVGRQPFGVDPVFGEEGERPFEEGRAGRCPLV